MDNEATPVANDNTNVQTGATEQQTPETNQAPETMLGGNTQQQAPEGAPEAYDFAATIPEGVEVDEVLTKGYSDIAREFKLTNEQANKMAAFGFEYAKQVAEAAQAKYNEEENAKVARWGEEAKQAMGAEFTQVMATAGAGLEAVEKVVPNIRQALNETGAGNRIEIIRAMEMLGKLVQADPGKLINAGTAPAQNQSKSWYDHSNMS